MFSSSCLVCGEAKWQLKWGLKHLYRVIALQVASTNRFCIVVERSI
ncbi:hypothetical protein ADIARSV_0328 [Arcticibacter svalbardensis MN12-7]|uniref:Uncharacterized protein n=1 Tax=Arcticibacter svalbardensis MN12-7 TaxID=1150600 RepID=R9GY36_9SPHI|nr:hypothetical protein ADIARSV_0328 [Arcticibacter svalbardensis MN12-7]